jgi:hypothetical protein
MTCCVEKREVFLGGGLVICSWGELRLGRKRRRIRRNREG